jgi:hypothetical protein
VEVPDELEDLKHVVSDSVVYVPEVNRVPTAIFCRVMPSEQEVRDAARLARVTFGQTEETVECRAAGMPALLDGLINTSWVRH